MDKVYQYKVEGISCINCSNGIKSHLKNNNIDKVYIDIASGQVRVESKLYTEEQVANYIKELGYNVQTLVSNKKSYKLEYYLLVSSLLSVPLLGHMFVSHNHILNNPWLQIILSTPIMIIGYMYFFKNALASLKNKKPNMNVLILMGSTAAYIYSIIGFVLNYNNLISTHKYLFFETAATIITLVLIGNYIEKLSINKTTSAIDALQKLQSKTANKIIGEQIITCPISKLNINDLIQVNEGDAIPCDGIIIAGEGSIDESMISGESSPSYKHKNEKVIGATILLEGNIRVKVSSLPENSVLAHIIEMVRSAQEDKPQIQQLGDKISAIFIPLVLSLAILTFAINFFIAQHNTQESIMRAIAVLVISCPCAMGLATPTAVMVGVGRAARNGILIKGGATIEQFAKTNKIIFDKTGTLTDGKFKIAELKYFSNNYDIESIVYELEKHSSHPIAQSLVNELSSVAKPITFKDVKEIKGKGLEAKDNDGNIYTFGSHHFCNITDTNLADKYHLFLQRNQELIAALAISDKIKEDAKELIDTLNSKGIKTTLLSGDKKHKCESVAKELNIAEVFYEHSPEEKIQKVKYFSTKYNTSMFGDGINDAPALSQAQVGISYSKATEVAVQSASIVLLNHKLNLIDKAHQLCIHTYLTIKQNLFWAFAYNIIAIPLAAMGYLSPIFAAFTMAFSDIVVIGNSIRLRYKNINN